MVNIKLYKRQDGMVNAWWLDDHQHLFKNIKVTPQSIIPLRYGEYLK